MKHELRRQIEINSKPLSISKNDFDTLVRAKNNLHLLYQMTETYAVVVESYKQLELSKFELEIDQLLFKRFEYNDVTNARIKLNAPISGFLSACRHLLDSYQQILGEILGKLEAKRFKQKTHELYDESFEYRFIEALRNYVQHHAAPIHNYRVDHYNDKSKHSNVSKAAIGISLLVRKDILQKSGDFKKSVLNEMPDSINLIHAFRVYLSKISDLYRFVVDTTNESGKIEREMIDDTKARYSEQTGLPSTMLEAVELDENGQEISKVNILTDWDDSRLIMHSSFKNLSYLPQWYISGKIK